MYPQAPFLIQGKAEKKEKGGEATMPVLTRQRLQRTRPVKHMYTHGAHNMKVAPHDASDPKKRLRQ